MKWRAPALAMAVAAAVGAVWAQGQEAAPRSTGATVMIVAPEYYLGLSMAEATAETELGRAFTEAGYRVLDQAQSAAIRYTPEMAEVIGDATGAKARELAAQHGADVVIVGKASCERVGEAAGGGTNCQAHLEVRAVAVRGDTVIIAATDATDAAVDNTESIAARKALGRAAEAVAPYLLERVGEFVGKAIKPLETVTPTQPTVTPPPATPPTTAATTPRVAVLSFENASEWAPTEWKLGRQIPDLIARELAKSDQVRVVERTALQKLVAQQGPEGSRLFNDLGKARELGALAEADYVVVGRINEFASDEVGASVYIAEAGDYAVNQTGHVSMAIKIIRVSDGTLLGTQEIERLAKQIVMGSGYQGIAFGSSRFNRTALGGATRAAVIEAANIIRQAR